MSEVPTVEQVMERIRAQVRQHQGNGASADPAATTERPRQAAARPPATARISPEDLETLRSEVTTTAAVHLQVGQLNPRRPGLHNNVLQFFKKLIRRSLTWYTRPLHLFQGSVIRALQNVTTILQKQSAALRETAEDIQSLCGQVTRLEEEHKDLENETASLREKQRDVEQKLQEKQRDLEQKLQAEVDKRFGSFAQQAGRVDALVAQVAAVQEELRQAAAGARGKERDLRRLRHAVDAGNLPSPRPSAPTPPMFPSEVRHDAEFDYFLFEEHYRGPETVIRGRQNAYLEAFRGRQDVVDIGCGRGEFLELLRDNNITARGVELGTDQYLLCREKGLDVVQQDLFTFLESQPDASLGGLFSAQVIEHMTASAQLRFVALAYQKCSSGSPVIFETINPECVYALVHNFFVDPTHIRPVHPGMLKFAMESQGFRDVHLRFSSPVSDKSIPRLAFNGDSEGLQRFNAAMEHVSELLYGDQDYAAIGWK